jgi:fatty acid desaturase
MCLADTVKEVKVVKPIANVKLSAQDEWIGKFDVKGFTEEVRELGKKLEAEQGPADVQHLNKMLTWSNSFAAVGLLSMGFAINPLSVICLSLYTCSRWTMIAHHTCHGGYDKCHPNKDRWSRFKFALGTLWRRWNDWFDWMMPEAWNVEHNNRHHYNLSETTDPDLVEQNLEYLRALNLPVFAKYIIVGFFMMSWKWFYYAPNTYKELKLAQWRREGRKIPKGIVPEESITFKDTLLGNNVFYSFFELITVVLAPYFLIHFFITPLPFLLLGEHLDGYTGMGMYKNAVINLFLAEILTNVHGFIVVVTNHAGDDMYRFRKPCRPFSGSFYLRQVIASVDYDYGTDSVDFLHGWLNYQIEHHMWPNLSMLSYRKAGPQVKAICDKYGVPYIKQSVWTRLKKTVDIMVGNSDMRWFPEEYEESYLVIDAETEKQVYKKE